MNNILLFHILAVCTLLITAIADLRTCKAPIQIIQNGRRSSLGVNYFRIGRTVRYWCDSGYTLKGNRFLKCSFRDGKATWVGTIPKCISLGNSEKSIRNYSFSNSASRLAPVLCPVHRLANGWAKITNYRLYGSVALYYCKRGWRLKGQNRRTCHRNGVWTGTLPTCKRIAVHDCGDPGSPKNGGRRLSRTTKGSIVTFYCKEYYKLVGYSKQICDNNGWSGKRPLCKPILCSPLSRPKYGSVIITGKTPLSIAKYSCNERYKLHGNKTRTCLGSNGWSGQKPSCQCYSCGDLRSPSNGFVKIYGSSTKARAKYYCKNGYSLRGAQVRSCHSICQWSGTEPICKRDLIECKALHAPKNGEVSVDIRTIGSIAYYKCNDGYQLFGHGHRQCLKDGIWSMEAPICLAINCKPLEPPIHGGVNVTELAFGSSAVYYCFDGYQLVGKDVSFCKKNGEWSAFPPSCNAINCGLPQRPNNGYVQYKNTVYHSIATYSCDIGFEISTDDDIRVCQKNAEWSGDVPLCKPIECDDLSSPVNGEVVCDDNVFDSVAKYNCQIGFELVGVATRVCMENKHWSGKKPFCKATVCDSLKAPVNGYIEYDDTVFESVAIYSCKQGYELIGDVTRLCQGNGIWSGHIPECEAIDCGPLNSLINGKIRVNETTLGSIATYTCVTGYVLNRNETRICQSNGVWSGIESICASLDGKDCGLVHNPVGGSVTLSSTAVGSHAKYFCNQGHAHVAGDEVRVCQDNLQWSGKAATCEAIQCPILEDPENGTVSFQNNTFKSEAFYVCQPGFIINGPPTRSCASDGKWTGRNPSCKLIDCGQLSNPSNGSVKLQSTTFLSVALYACDNGLVLVGNPVRECMANGQWSGQAPSCSDGDSNCLPLPNLENGMISVDGLNEGSVARYMCDSRYRLVGEDSVRVCEGAQSGWSGQAPTCQLIQCPVLQNPTNGLVSVNTQTVYSLANFSCNVGFFLVGSETLECRDTGLWSKEPPQCEEIIDCGVLTNIEFGTVKFNATFNGSVAVYECQIGYILTGDNNTRVCQDNGEWSGQEPVCNIVDCGQITSPDNGHLVDIGTTVFGSTIMYECNVGYKLVGVKMRYCQVNGEWAGDEPFCQAIETTETCDDPGVPLNGVRAGDDLVVGSSLFYRCNDGYILMGSKVRTCQENSVFSGIQPTCKPFDDRCQGSSSIVFDQCDRMCECVDKKLVNCSRLRRDWINLTTGQKLRYIDAVKTLASDKLYKPRYEALLKQHMDSFKTDAQASEPSISQFIPYSRYFLLQYENLLKEIDCRITIPYWDWTAFPEKPYQSPVWDNQFGFGNTSRTTDNCVATGPFRYPGFLIPDSNSYRCIHREYKAAEFPRREKIERDLLPLPASEFSTVHRQLQIYIGTAVLCYVGGDLCSPISAHDPIYLLHLSHVDFVFDRWQRFGDGRETARYSNDRKALVFGEGLLVSDMISNKALPAGIVVMYDKPVLHKNHSPPFLQLYI